MRDLPALRLGTDNDVICFDFDGVLAEPIWPDPGIGAPIEEGLQLLKYLYSCGFEVIIHTARHWASWRDIRAWVMSHTGIDVHVVCGKPLAQLYIDDRGYRFEPAEGGGAHPQPLPPPSAQDETEIEWEEVMD